MVNVPNILEKNMLFSCYLWYSISIRFNFLKTSFCLIAYTFTVFCLLVLVQREICKKFPNIFVVMSIFYFCQFLLYVISTYVIIYIHLELMILLTDWLYYQVEIFLFSASNSSCLKIIFDVSIAISTSLLLFCFVLVYFPYI